MAEILLARLDDIAANVGEANTASNVGSVGTGVFKQKTLMNLEFYKLNAASSKMTITLNGTDRIDFDVVEAQIAIGNLSGTLAIAKGGTGQTTAAAARLAFGFPVALDTLWTAVSLAAGRLALGFPVALDAVWTAVSAAAARIALGFPAALDTLWTATTFANARTALGLVPGTDVLAPTGSGSALTGIRKQGKESIWVPANSLTPALTNGPGLGSIEMATNKQMFVTHDYDPTTQEFDTLVIKMPKSWNLGTITYQIVWSHAATTTNFGVAYTVKAVAVSDDDAGDVAFGTSVQVTDTGGTTNDIYISPESGAITIAGTPAAGDLVFFRMARVPADAGDTLAVDMRLHGIMVHYTTNAADDT